jgi:hypothetical protein
MLEFILNTSTPMRECQHADKRWTTGTASCTATNAIFRLQVPIFFALNRFGFRFDHRHNLAASVLRNKSAGVQWQKSRCISVVRLVMAVALEIVWRNPEPPAHSDPKITRSAPGEYSLEGQNFAIVHRAANKICDDYGYMPLAVSQDNK